MISMTIPTYRKILADELAKRVDVNPRFSLRSFARLLGISPGALSQILRGGRSVSDRLIERIFGVLELGETERSEFLASLLEEKRSQGKRRISKKLKAHGSVRKSGETGDGFRGIGLDEFRVIADWYHYAILVMAERPDFDPRPSKIASRLDITPLEAKLGLERLQSLELLESENGVWKRTNLRIQTKDLSKMTESHRRRYRQVLDRARDSIDTVPIDLRHHGAITINIPPSRIVEAKEKIQAALWSIASDLESQTEGSKVYELALQIFPLERTEK